MTASLMVRKLFYPRNWDGLPEVTYFLQDDMCFFTSTDGHTATPAIPGLVIEAIALQEGRNPAEMLWFDVLTWHTSVGNGIRRGHARMNVYLVDVEGSGVRITASLNKMEPAPIARRIFGALIGRE